MSFKELAFLVVKTIMELPEFKEVLMSTELSSPINTRIWVIPFLIIKHRALDHTIVNMACDLEGSH